MSDNLFDFGFTLVDELELEAVTEAQQAVNEVAQTSAELQAKIDKLYNAIQPLLNNLKKNPEKEYIHWPNRIQKVEEFENYLLKIYGE
jgi:hypothetical protein